MKLKKTTAALLVAGLTVAGSSYAWANETILKPIEGQTDSETELTTTVEIEPVVTLDPLENESEESATLVSADEDTKVENNTTVEGSKENETTQNEFPEIPEGYTAGNLVALKQAYENAGSENAKQAILKNAHKAIAKFKAKNGLIEAEKETEIKVDLELVGEIQPGETIIEPVNLVTDETSVTSTGTTVKTEQQILTKDQQKAEKKALKAQQKAEKNALKAEKKASKHKE